MHLNGLLGDFYNAQSSFKELKGLVVLKTPDPMSLFVVKNILLQISNTPTKIVFGGEIQSDWITSEFIELSLFSEQNHYFVHSAEDLKSPILGEILDLDLIDRLLILSFGGDHTHLKKILKSSKEHIQSITIDEPSFWQFERVVDFLCDYFHVQLSSEAREWMLQMLENNLPHFYHAFEVLLINYPELSVFQKSHLEELLSPDRIDHFMMADLYLNKKFKEFFQKILFFEGDFDRARGLFSFMQSHLIKVLDPNYSQKKKKLSRYDQTIQKFSRLWKEENLLYSLDKFNLWEMMAKRKEDSLWTSLKSVELGLMNT